MFFSRFVSMEVLLKKLVVKGVFELNELSLAVILDIFFNQLKKWRSMIFFSSS